MPNCSAVLVKKIKQFNVISINIIGIICCSGFINAQAQEVFEQQTSSIDTSYLQSKDEMKDYILDTGDILKIRFKNRPRKGSKEKLIEKISTSDISYLEPRSNLKNYILDSGDAVSLKFIKTPGLSGNFTIDQEGEVILPRIKNAYIKGLTISELKILLEKRYEEYLISPEIEIRITNFKFIPNGEFTIDQEGEILLPEIPNDLNEVTRKTYVRGLTTTGLEKLLEKRYSKYLINPKVFVSISKYKPIRVSIRGEVRKTGLVQLPSYLSSSISNINPLINERERNNLVRSSTSENFSEITPLDMESDINSKRISNNLNSQNLFPERNPDVGFKTYITNRVKRETQYLSTLSNAIQKAGGLTSFSDISNIKIVRYIPIEKGGGKKIAFINFLSYIEKSDDTNDIRLFDGDSIFIPSLKKRDPKIIPQSILAGLSPKFINVAISGQIENPGTVQIPVEGSLSDLMNLTGPRKPLSGKIYLIRYNPDGTLLREDIQYSANATPGSNKNPFLLDDDLITVRKSILGRTSGTIKAVTEPFLGIYATKELVDNFTENF